MSTMTPPAPKEPSCMKATFPYYNLYIYELKNSIDIYTASLIWSIFSEREGLYFNEEGPVFNTIVCKYPIDIANIHEKIVDASILYSIPQFDTVSILPKYTLLRTASFVPSPCFMREMAMTLILNQPNHT